MYYSKLFKNIIRKNYYFEIVGYILQNNFFQKFNFIGSGNFEQTTNGIYSRFLSIAYKYLELLADQDVMITKNTLIIELGVGFSTIACLELSKKTNCSKVIAYDAFYSIKKDIDKVIKEKYYSDITNVEYILGIKNLDKFLKKNINQYDKFIVFSNTVLQHVWNVNELIETLDKYSPLNSVQFHTIDFRNLNKFDKYGELYFLKFSNITWKLMADKIGNQNRLRYKFYTEIFVNYGYNIKLLKFEKFPEEVINKAIQTYLKDTLYSKDESLIYSIVLIKCLKIKNYP